MNVAPGSYCTSRMRWNPWAALREREHIDFEIHRLPDSMGGGVHAVWPDGKAQIVLDDRLSFVERRCGLSHELIHDERGGVIDSIHAPRPLRELASREERSVDREVSRRLVPPDELKRFVSARVGVDLGVTAWEVAEEFDVTDTVAERALRQLAENPSGWEMA